MSHRLRDFRRWDVGVRCGPPNQWHTHERIDVIWTLEQQSEVTLQLAVIGGEKDVGARIPAALDNAPDHPAARLIDQLVLDVNHRVDLAHLVVCHLAGYEIQRTALDVAETALVPVKPVARSESTRLNSSHVEISYAV